MKQFQDELKVSNGGDYQLFESIEVGNYELSIQGSQGAYCSPRESLKPEYYTSMEIAIFKNDKWLNVVKSSVMRKFPRYNELKERADGWFPNKGGCSGRVVFGYVPVDLIQDLYEYLKTTS
jgi:hypothetical protein